MLSEIISKKKKYSFFQHYFSYVTVAGWIVLPRPQIHVHLKCNLVGQQVFADIIS